MRHADRPAYVQQYSDARLKEIRREYLEENRPDEYKRLIEEGTLDAHLDKKAEMCREEQKPIVGQGLARDSQAWSWAIRSELLDTEWD